MFLRPRLCLPLLATLLLGVGAAAAQQKGSSTLHPRVGPPVRTIYLDVVVTPKSGVPVAGLAAKDFSILDDKTPRTITSFHAYDGVQPPTEVILLIDSVNSDFNIVAQERIEVDRFLHANGGQLVNPVKLEVLDDMGLKTLAGYTHDGNALAKTLDAYGIGLREIGRSTGIEGAGERFDDSMKALRTLAEYESGRPGRKVVLWVSPGWPLLSGPEIQLSSEQEQGIFNEITWLSMAFRETQTTVYALNPLGVDESLSQAFYYEQFLDGVKKQGDVNFGNLALQVIAVQTGGLALSSSDVSGPLLQCMAQTKTYYRISFEPPPTEHRDVYHRLEIKVADPGLTAHTSTGYYDEP